MNKEIKFRVDWLLWFLILLPTFYIVGKDIRHAQMNFFQLSVILLVAVMHINRWFGAFLAWCAIQFMFFAGGDRGEAILLQNVFFSALLYHFVVKYVGKMKKYYWALFGLLCLNVLWAFMQSRQFDPIFSPINPQIQTIFSDVSGFFCLPAFFAIFAAVIAPLCIFLSPFLAIAVIPALIVGKSSFAMAGAASGILFMLWFRKRIIFWVLLVFMLVGGSFYIVKYDAPTGQFSRRLTAWKLILTEGFRRQFFGHGLGAYGRDYTFMECVQTNQVAIIQTGAELLDFSLRQAVQLKNEEIIKYIISKNGQPFNFDEFYEYSKTKGFGLEPWGQAHNEYLQVFFNGGLVGLFLVIGYIFNLFKRFFSIKSKDYELMALMGAFVAICIVSFAHFPFQVARLAGPVLVVMALLEAKLLRYEGE